jgi:hypothetical protein
LAASDSGAPRKGGRLTTIICALAAPFTLYLVARTAVLSTQPAAAESLPPVNDALRLRQVAAAAANPSFKVDDAALELARQGAQADPLDFAPFFIAARAADQRGDAAGALRLMEEARRRNPTSLPIRIFLVSQYFSARRVPEMIAELDYTLRRDERARIALLPELVKLLRLRQGRTYVAQLLAANPPWKEDLFNVAREQKLPPEIALDLLRLAAARGGDTGPEQRLVVSSLFRSGRPDLARERWLAMLPAAQRDESRFLFNGDFERPASTSEFAWKLHGLDVGRADMVTLGAGDGRLRVQYFGGSTAVLAEQQLALAPGRYQLQVTGRSRSSLPPGQLFWTITCYPDGPDVHRMPVENFGPQDKNLSSQFSVPGGACRGQTLRLVAEPGEISSASDAEFAKMNIDVAR